MQFVKLDLFAARRVLVAVDFQRREESPRKKKKEEKNLERSCVARLATHGAMNPTCLLMLLTRLFANKVDLFADAPMDT